MTDSARPMIEAPDDDPWIWLEEVEGQRALAWVEAQNRATLSRFRGPGFAAERDALKATLDRPDRIAVVSRRGGLLYDFWQDAARPRGVWRRTTLESYRGETPDWEMLLDLDALAATEGEDWVWAGATSLPSAHTRVILSLSRGGGDATVLREFDLETLGFVPDGFRLAEAKSQADWLDIDTMLLSSAIGEGMATAAGYARTVRLWRRGATPGEVLFETDAAHMSVSARLDRTADAERVVFIERTGFFDAVVRLGDRTGPGTRLDLPTDARSDWHGDWLTVEPRTAWTAGGTVHPPDTVVGFRLSAFLAGERRGTVLFEPGERLSLQGSFWAGERLVLSILDELRPVFRAFVPGDDGWEKVALPGLPDEGVVSVWRFDREESESDGTLLASAQDPVTPPQLMMVARGSVAPEILKRSPATFDASDLTVTRHEAISADGERIPYVQTGPAGETGEAPVHLTGYGGFQLSSAPRYDRRVGQLWLGRGGTSVLAHLRGGGEFGTRWHEAGRREGKTRSHDDFAAVAADLVRRGVTRPGRIAAEGGSNGGLLIANMLTRYPGLFGALFCTIPLVDMRRYTRLLAGASWIAEYGDPDKPEDWDFMCAISAYHAAVPGRDYPPILLATTRRDDRVHPGHARKMAAKLQAMGYRAWFHEPSAGGHGYGKDSGEIAAFSALGFAFLRSAIGWGAGLDSPDRNARDVRA